jgi:TolB-like protein/Flp pilus assembly protein TadD
MITVQLLGGASLRSHDGPLTGPPAQRHRIALLSLVVCAWPQPLARDRALALLWPEKDTTSARRLLNLAVHVLRSALGDDAIASSGDGLLLDPARITCDLYEFREAIAAGDVERAVRLYTGPLLDGFHLDESTEFGYWLDEHRVELAHAYVGALREMAQRQEQAGDVHGRVGTCRKLVAVDPHSGAYACALMLALDAAGDRAGARQHALEHANRVRADLDLEPDPRVVELAERLRSAPQRVSIPVAASRTTVASVAVLPFRNLTVDPENDFFADGITEDVIAQLSKIHTLKVISHSSVMRFRKREQTFHEIGGALGATTVLDGSVRRAGDRVRIVAQLVALDPERLIWSESFDRMMTDIFEIQSEVALHIASALRAELTPDERKRVLSRPTLELRAYTLFLKGRQHYIRFTSDSIVQAIDYFERAIATDPNFALAHATLAMACIEQAELGAFSPELAYPRAERAAAAALRIDPELAESHCTMAYLRAVRDHDWAAAEQGFRRALELSPSNAATCDLYGRMCAALERYDESIALLQRAQELDPLARRCDSATMLLRAGRVEEAMRRAESAVELDPVDRACATLGWAYFMSGRRDEALAQLERAASSSPASTIWLAQLGQAYAMAGNRTRAHEILDTLTERARHGYVSPYHFAYVLTGLGEMDRAMDYLERAVAERTGASYGIKGSFLFKPLRGHPRFSALLRQMNLAG